MFLKGLKFTAIIIFISTLSLSAQQSLTLEDCKRFALEHNYKVRIAEEQIGAANALSSSAKTGFYPNINANALYTRTNRQITLLEEDLLIPVVPWTSINPESGTFDPNRDPENTFAFNPVTGDMLYDRDGNPVFNNYAWLPQDHLNFGSKNFFAGGISVMQPIYTGGKIREMYRIAQHGQQLAQANLTKEQTDVIYKTEESYWRVVSLQEKVSMVKSYIELLERLSADLENLYREGIIIKNDLLKVGVKTNEAQLNLLKAKNGLTLSRMALCQITGLPLSSELVLIDSLDSSISIMPEMSFVDSALLQRPELEVLNQTLNIAKSGVNLMRSRYMPNIGVSANYMMMNPNPYRGFSEEFGGDWNIGIAINIPIFHWNDKAHTLRAAKHGQRAAELQLAEARELVALQVQQAIFETNESTKKVAMAKENLRLAEENLKVANNTFAEGMIKTTDVLEAQALWQNAWSDLIDARMEYQLSRVNLKRVIGTLKQ